MMLTFLRSYGWGLSVYPEFGSVSFPRLWKYLLFFFFPKCFLPLSLLLSGIPTCEFLSACCCQWDLLNSPLKKKKKTCWAWVLSVTLSYKLLIHSSAFSHVMLIASSVFFIPFIVSFNSDWLCSYVFYPFVNFLTQFIHSSPVMWVYLWPLLWTDFFFLRFLFHFVWGISLWVLIFLTIYVFILRIQNNSCFS